jgi:polysaccharide pyruvyl transferase CsaB
MKIIIFGWYGAGNIGDEAILQSMLSSFQLQNDLEIDIVSFNPAKTARMVKQFSCVKNIVRIGSKFNFLKSDFRGIWRSLKNAQAVIIGGGGLFQDIYNFNFIPFFSIIVIIAAYLRKRINWYAVGIGPFKRRIARWLCRQAANRAHYISVRDPLSQKRLSELNIQQKIFIAPDPVFLLKPASPSKVQSMLTSEGLDISSHPKIGICLQRLFDWGKQSESILSDIMDQWVRDREAEIVFIPLGRYPDSWFNSKAADVDVIIAEKLARLLKSKSVVLSGEYTPDEIMAIIGEMDVIISMRLHGIIMSLARGIPSLALTYRKESKLSSLLTQSGFEENIFFVDNLNKNELMAQMDFLLDNYREQKEATQHAARTLKQQAKNGMQSLIDQLYRK